MVIYYTGTGNSRYTAQALSHMAGQIMEWNLTISLPTM